LPFLKGVIGGGNFFCGEEVNLLTRSKKGELIKRVCELWKKAKGIVFYDFEKMKANEAVDFRKELKNSGLRAFVSKNTLIKIGARNSGITLDEKIEEVFSKQTGIVVSFEEPLSPCKVVYDFFKRNGKPAIKGGFIDGKFVYPKDIEELAKVSSKEAVYQRLASVLLMPQANLAMSLNGIISKLLYALNALKSKKESN